MFKPTEEMLLAGMEASLLGRPSVDDDSYVRSIWEAMWRALMWFRVSSKWKMLCICMTPDIQSMSGPALSL